MKLNNNLALEAFILIYPNRDIRSYKISLSYSGRFKDFGANVKYRMNKIDFFLSKKWIGVNNHIVIGLLHTLYVKVFSTKNPSTEFYIDLYNAYVKNMHLAVEKTKIDPFLEESFDRINEKYFFNELEKSNLVWGNYNSSKLGEYNYHSDTITMSTILKNKDLRFLDYVMHHEMLHKHLKFIAGKKKSTFHTKEFRLREKQFEDAELIEKAIKNGFKFQKKPKIFSFWQ